MLLCVAKFEYMVIHVRYVDCGAEIWPGEEVMGTQDVPALRALSGFSLPADT